MKRTIFYTFLSFLLLVSCKQETYFNITTCVQPSNGGSIIITPPSGSILEGSSVSFNASPKGDYVFTGWSGSLSGTENPKTVTVTSDLNVIANFELKTYPLNVSIEGEGVVNERVISTKTDYSSGTIVELTATPASGWSFDHWEGDLSGSINPERITVLGDKSVKAVFTKNKYAYNLKIVGPGVVDEYLLPNTRAEFEYGTKVLLKAIPSEGSVFKGWSGDVSGNASEITVNIEDNKEIVALFAKAGLRYPLPDLMQPSAKLKRHYPEIDFSQFCGHCNGYLAVDYNRDGYLDIITFDTDWSADSRFPIHFYLSNENGEFIIDELNDSKLLGMNNNRKSVFGDFNADGFPDIALIGHGYDNDPWPGEYPVILLSQNGPIYKDLRFPNYVSYYHGGASGDIDNDGDIDLFLVDTGRGKSLFLVNNGFGLFETKLDLVDQSLMTGMTIAELFDIDHDGNIDLICAGDDTWGSEHIGWPWDVNNMPIVFWGDGSGAYCDYLRFPESHIRGYDGTIDMTFFDLNGDGKEEIIMSRTGSLVNEVDVTERWAVQILEVRGRTLIDVTQRYLVYDDSFSMEDDNMLFWIEFDEYKGKTYMAATKSGPNAKFYFRIEDGRLIPKWNKMNYQISYDDGVCLYSDSKGNPEQYVNLGCAESPFAGSTCIKFSDYRQWDPLFIYMKVPNQFVFSEYDAHNCADLSALVNGDYYLEFYIRNDNPNLELDIRAETIPNLTTRENATLNARFRASDYLHDGRWERVIIPLRDESFDDWSRGEVSFWPQIDHFVFVVASDTETPFYLDEIRIRRILDAQ